MLIVKIGMQSEGFYALYLCLKAQEENSWKYNGLFFFIYHLLDVLKVDFEVDFEEVVDDSMTLDYYLNNRRDHT